jgi:hypothetical protein
MESTAESGKLQISETTYKLLSDDIKTDFYPQLVSIKGFKGNQRTFVYEPDVKYSVDLSVTCTNVINQLNDMYQANAYTLTSTSFSI